MATYDIWVDELLLYDSPEWVRKMIADELNKLESTILRLNKENDQLKGMLSPTQLWATGEFYNERGR